MEPPQTFLCACLANVCRWLSGVWAWEEEIWSPGKVCVYFNRCGQTALQGGCTVCFPSSSLQLSECFTSSPTLNGIRLVGLHHSGGCVGGSGCVFIHILLGIRKIITVGGDCCHEIKRRLIPGRKAMTNLDSILKSRGITLLAKDRLVKAMVFPVVTYRCKVGL